MTEIVEAKPKNELAVFDEVASIIAEYKAKNEDMIFDYAGKEGAKMAKSHISNLRKVKGKVGEIHKEAKAEALAFGRRLDAKKNEYNGEVDKMIKVHKDPLDAIEAEVIAEATRKAREHADAEAKRLAEIEARERAIIIAEEKIAREKDEVKEKIRREAIEAGERIMKKQQEQIAKAEEEKRIAEEAAENIRMEAALKSKAEAEARDLADEKLREEEVAKKKLSEDKRHRMRIENEIHESLMTNGFNPDMAYSILVLLKQDKIPHVSIDYSIKE